jgi:hypothetical protein
MGGGEEKYAGFIIGNIKNAQLKLVEYYGDHRASLDTEYIGKSESRRDKNSLEEQWRVMLDWAINQKIVHKSLKPGEGIPEIHLQTPALKAIIRNLKGAYNKKMTKYTASGAAPPPEGSWDEKFLEVRKCSILGKGHQKWTAWVLTSSATNMQVGKAAFTKVQESVPTFRSGNNALGGFYNLQNCMLGALAACECNSFCLSQLRSCPHV